MYVCYLCMYCIHLRRIFIFAATVIENRNEVGNGCVQWRIYVWMDAIHSFIHTCVFRLKNPDPSTTYSVFFMLLELKDFRSFQNNHFFLFRNDWKDIHSSNEKKKVRCKQFNLCWVFFTGFIIIINNYFFNGFTKIGQWTWRWITVGYRYLFQFIIIAIETIKDLKFNERKLKKSINNTVASRFEFHSVQLLSLQNHCQEHHYDATQNIRQTNNLASVTFDQ